MAESGPNPPAGAMNPFVAQYFSMAIPMIVGCLPTCMVAFGLLHVNLSALPVGFVFALVVTLAMTVPMAAWMHLGMGHSRRCTLEMSSLMFLPLVALIPYAAGSLPGGLLCPVLCGGMFLLMLADMFYRREMYGGRPDWRPNVPSPVGAG